MLALAACGGSGLPTEQAQLLPWAEALEALIGDLGVTIRDNGAALRTVGGNAAVTAVGGASRRAEWAVAEARGTFGLRSTATALQLLRTPEGSLALAEPRGCCRRNRPPGPLRARPKAARPTPRSLPAPRAHRSPAGTPTARSRASPTRTSTG